MVPAKKAARAEVQRGQWKWVRGRWQRLRKRKGWRKGLKRQVAIVDIKHVRLGPEPNLLASPVVPALMKQAQAGLR